MKYLLIGICLIILAGCADNTFKDAWKVPIGREYDNPDFDKLWNSMSDSNGDILLDCDQNLYQFDKNEFVPIDLQLNKVVLNNDSSWMFLNYDSRNIYSTVYRYKDKKKVIVLKYDNNKWEKIDAFEEYAWYYEDFSKRLWLFDPEFNLTLYKGKEKRYLGKLIEYNKHESDSCSFFFREGLEGKMWIKVAYYKKDYENYTLNCYDGKMYHIFSAELPKHIKNIIELEHNILLISSDFCKEGTGKYGIKKGKDSISLERLKYKKNEPNFNATIIISFFRESQKKLWLVTRTEDLEWNSEFPYKDDLWLYENGSFKLIKKGLSLDKWELYTSCFDSFLLDDCNNLWIGTWSRGVMVVDKDKKINIVDWNKGLNIRRGSGIYKDKKGNIFFIGDSQQKGAENKVQILKADYINAIINKKAGQIYNMHYTIGDIMMDSLQNYWWVTVKKGTHYLEEYDSNTAKPRLNISELGVKLESKYGKKARYECAGIDSSDRIWLYFSIDSRAKYYTIIFNPKNNVSTEFLVEDAYKNIVKENGNVGIKMNSSDHLVCFSKDNFTAFIKEDRKKIRYWNGYSWDYMDLGSQNTDELNFKNDFFINIEGLLSINAEGSQKDNKSKSYVYKDQSWELSSKYYTDTNQAKINDAIKEAAAKTKVNKEKIIKAIKIGKDEYFLKCNEYGLLYYKDNMLYTLTNFPDYSTYDNSGLGIIEKILIDKGNNLWIGKKDQYYPGVWEWVNLSYGNLNKVKQSYQIRKKSYKKPVPIKKGIAISIDITKEAEITREIVINKKAEITRTPDELYDMLLSKDSKKQIEAQKGFVEMGQKGKEYLLKKLKEAKSADLKWRIEAIISQIK